jgi:hypothetical protein
MPAQFLGHPQPRLASLSLIVRFSSRPPAGLTQVPESAESPHDRGAPHGGTGWRLRPRVDGRCTVDSPEM